MSSLNYSFVNKDEKAQGLNLIYSLIDSKIDIIDRKVRRIIESLKSKNEKKHHSLSALEDELNLNLLQDEMTYIGASSPIRFFSEVENMSRSIYLLERMKLDLSPDNLTDVMFLLEDDKFLTLPEHQLRKVFERGA